MIPRKSTLLNMPFEKITKYEDFFKTFQKHLMTIRFKNELKTLIQNERRDTEKSLLKDFEDGYCPRKWQSLKYSAARVILMNINDYISEYNVVVAKIKE